VLFRSASTGAAVTGRRSRRFAPAISPGAGAQDGHSTGGRVFGYTNVPVDPSNPRSRRRYVIHESVAAVVRRIFELYADGHSLVGIATRLNK